MKTRVSLDEELAKLSRDVDAAAGTLAGRRSRHRPHAAQCAAFVLGAVDGVCGLGGGSVPGRDPRVGDGSGAAADDRKWLGRGERSGHGERSGCRGESGGAGLAAPLTARLIAGLAAHGRRLFGGRLRRNFGEPNDPRYLAARAELERTFNQRLGELDPATRAKIEADLASIRKARDDIRKALAAQPDSPVLEQLLASALHDEFDLYDAVVRTTQPTSARI